MFSFPVDQMVGGIFYEHSHRMIASAVGFLTFILALWLWKKEDRKWVRILGITALATVIAQGVLGGLTVLFLLPTSVSVSHATLAQTFFTIIVTLALVTSVWWRSPQPRFEENNKRISLTKIALATTILVYVQLIIGALMRHTNSGLAVPDFPLAYGQLFPSLSAESLDGYNHQLIQMNLRLAADDPVTAIQIIIHMLHRFGALLVTGGILWTSIRLLKYKSQSRRLFLLGISLILLLLFQLILGALTVLTAKSIGITTAHVANGAALLACCTLTFLHSVKFVGFGFRDKRHVIFSMKEATV
jgi:cytochrome c oxidase assembly protein subunit 15